MVNKYNNQKGFTLVQAVFILVVLSLLGAVMMRMIGVQSATSVFALQGARAYQAARSGLEWGAARVLEGGDDCVNIVHDNDDEGILIKGFVVKIISCTNQPFTEAAKEYNVYTLESLATFGEYGSPNFVSRRVQMKVGSYDVE